MDWNSPYIQDLITAALAEDVGCGDATVEATIPMSAAGEARIIARQQLTCAGLPLAGQIFQRLDPAMNVRLHVSDGDTLQRGAELLHLSGKASAILTGERTALNFLGHLSGIATLASRFVKELAGTHTKIRDTRKTTPGLRLLEKYAVRMGGGTNHRIGLFDAIQLKENHIALAGGIKAALDQAHTYVSAKTTSPSMTAYEAVGTPPPADAHHTITIQIEVRNEQELREALSAGAESVLLDNMSPDKARHCVQVARGIRPDCIIEISGGITLENARAYALTGADYLSSGSLTHSAPAADLSLLVDSIQ